MLERIHSAINSLPTSSVIIISVAFMLFFGFAMTRLTKLMKLPNVTAYIIVGIIIGPYCLGLVPSPMINGMSFLSDIALAFIAFSTGEYFRLETLRKNGARVVVVTVFESLLASVAVFAVMYFGLGLELAFSIVIAALASATAPASTMMTIRQTNSKGDFVDTLLQVVALDDVVGLVAYSIAISIAVASLGSGSDVGVMNVIKPLGINTAVFVIGGIFGVIMKLLMPKKRSTDNRLIISVAMLFAFCGVCALLDVSPLLGCMSMGTVYINITDDDKLFKQLNYFSPPILLLFFVRSGLSFRLDFLVGSSVAVGSIPLIFVGVLYFIVRIIGKYFGAFFGCMIAGKSKKVRNWLGFALIPQAGVAIGLAAIGARTLGGEIGEALNTVILASSVLYELAGPACAKLSLYKSGSYSNKLEDLVEVSTLHETGKAKTPTELLIERINAIQKELPTHEYTTSEEEKAFLEAAEEQQRAASENIKNRRRFGFYR